MSGVIVSGLDQVLRWHAGPRWAGPDRARRIAHRGAGPVGQRQDHPAADAGRFRAGRRRARSPSAPNWSTPVTGADSYRPSGGGSGTSPRRVLLPPSHGGQEHRVRSPAPARRGPRGWPELIDLVGLTGLDSRYPHQLRGTATTGGAGPGPRRRAPLVLLDEPFSSLDAGLRATVRGDVRRILKETGTTTLLVTHDQDEALSRADSWR